MEQQVLQELMPWPWPWAAAAAAAAAAGPAAHPVTGAATGNAGVAAGKKLPGKGKAKGKAAGGGGFLGMLKQQVKKTEKAKQRGITTDTLSLDATEKQGQNSGVFKYLLPPMGH
jgi:hypothetical protein